MTKRDHEYRRCGTANIFRIVEPKGGRHFTRVTPNRSARQFAFAVRDLVDAYPRVRTIHLVMDNLNIHCERSLITQFGAGEARRLWRRLTIHHTPKHGSWLNQAELELSLVARQCLGTRRIPQRAQLGTHVAAWNRRANRLATRINWGFTRKHARTKFGYRFKQTI